MGTCTRQLLTRVQQYDKPATSNANFASPLPEAAVEVNSGKYLSSVRPFAGTADQTSCLAAVRPSLFFIVLSLTFAHVNNSIGSVMEASRIELLSKAGYLLLFANCCSCQQQPWQRYGNQQHQAAQQSWLSLAQSPACKGRTVPRGKPRL